MSWYATKKASKLPSLDKSKILVFDVETTGFEPLIDEIIQITILDGFGSILFDSYIKPKHHKKWEDAEAVNHINYDMVKNSPTFSKAKKEIQKIFNKASLVVGYNVNFDINFVKANGIVVSGQIFDVMTAFASYYSSVNKKFYHNWSLKQCAKYFGHSYIPHDSSQDAAVTLECFNSLIEDPRFTTYKRKEKKKIKEEMPEPVVNTDISFSIKLPTFRRHNIAILGIIIFLLSQIYFYFTNGSIILDINEIVLKITNIQSIFSKNLYEGIALIALCVSCLLIIIGFTSFIVRFPRVIIEKIKHFFNRFL